MLPTFSGWGICSPSVRIAGVIGNKIKGTPINISSARPLRFAESYSRVKFIGTIATIIWGFGLIDVVVVRLLPTQSIASVVVAVVAVAALFAACIWYFRSGMNAWSSSPSCSVVTETGGCSQPDCDVAGGGCLAKLDREVASRIAEMERAKLGQLLRHRFGLELLFPVFWLVVGVKLSFGSSLTSDLGGLALAVGSLGLAAARIYIGRIVFD